MFSILVILVQIILREQAKEFWALLPGGGEQQLTSGQLGGGSYPPQKSNGELGRGSYPPYRSNGWLRGVVRRPNKTTGLRARVYDCLAVREYAMVYVRQCGCVLCWRQCVAVCAARSACAAVCLVTSYNMRQESARAVACISSSAAVCGKVWRGGSVCRRCARWCARSACCSVQR
jgi:hypothetical protein